MTIPDDDKKPKLSKSRDALAALRAAMEQRLAEINAPQPQAQPEPAPKPAESPAPPQPKKRETKPAATKAPDAKPPETKLPDPAEWSRTMFRIAERSQKLIQEFLSRQREIPTMPAFDPARIGEAFMELTGRLLNDPERFVDAQISLAQGYIRIWQTALAKMQGKPAPAIMTPLPGDKRFQDEAWQDVWLFDYIKQTYLLTADWINGLVRQEAEKLDPKLAQKIDFYTKQMVDAISPSNFWLTNPQVLRTTIETGGENLVKGLENLLDDLERGNGQLRIRMSDAGAFSVGGNLATTPGKVVFQNELMQLIQYEPLTPNVHRVPLLIVPPWINKYYILDLREKNSYIRYLVEQGYTVFCVSWVNPDKRHAQIGFDDYMALGTLAAMREVKHATGENDINIVGYCIGGTLLSITLAYLKKLPPNDLPNIKSATFLVTLTDFKEPGDLGVFIDEAQVEAIEARMAQQGYLDAASLALTFNMLRANDLVWSFVVNNYLLGKEPFPFDILYWNADSTNLPARMQSFYLRNMYMKNKLVEPNGITMKDVPIDLGLIDTPAFFLSTHDDHIAPWRSTYAATQIFKGPLRFVLAGSGHIAGIVNSPALKKYCYWTNAALPPKPEDWFKLAEQHPGSWWPEWLDWLKQYAGEDVPARKVTGGIESAPGSYVKVKAV